MNEVAGAILYIFLGGASVMTNMPSMEHCIAAKEAIVDSKRTDNKWTDNSDYYEKNTHCIPYGKEK